jgi:glycosyltransferase involved in cell wall biosynthesis
LAIGVLAVLASLIWIVAPLISFKVIRCFPPVGDGPLPEPPPKLSVIIAACNEGKTIEPALSSVLAQTYPSLEIVVVDDRSTDETGAIVDRLAARDPRVKAIHISELPEGWLGKVHALHRGVEQATGQWLLFTDADVHFAARAFDRAIAFAEARALDHLFLFPSIKSSSFLVDLMIASAVRGIGLSQKPWLVSDPKREEAIGGGVFNLARRSAFDRTPGFPWLALEVADDIGLAQMLKKHGARTGGGLGGEIVEIEWYPSVRDCLRGMEKNAFAQLARFSLFRGLAFAGLASAVALLPFVAVGHPAWWVRGVGAAALVASAVNAILIHRWSGAAFLPLWLSSPLGDLLMSVLLVRATILGVLRGGVVWRGTLYPTEILVKGIRVRF